LPDIQIATQHNRLFSQPPVPRNTVRLFRASNVWREIIYILKLEASVCVGHGSQRALTLYTQQQTALLRLIYQVSVVVGS